MYEKEENNPPKGRCYTLKSIEFYTFGTKSKKKNVAIDPGLFTHIIHKNDPEVTTLNTAKLAFFL